MKNLSEKILILKTPQREGLIRARVFGARQAVGQVSVSVWSLEYICPPVFVFYGCATSFGCDLIPKSDKLRKPRERVFVKHFYPGFIFTFFISRCSIYQSIYQAYVPFKGGVGETKHQIH